LRFVSSFLDAFSPPWLLRFRKARRSITASHISVSMAGADDGAEPPYFFLDLEVFFFVVFSAPGAPSQYGVLYFIIIDPAHPRAWSPFPLFSAAALLPPLSTERRIWRSRGRVVRGRSDPSATFPRAFRLRLRTFTTLEAAPFPTGGWFFFVTWWVSCPIAELFSCPRLASGQSSTDRTFFFFPLPYSPVSLHTGDYSPSWKECLLVDSSRVRCSLWKELLSLFFNKMILSTEVGSRTASVCGLAVVSQHPRVRPERCDYQLSQLLLFSADNKSSSSLRLNPRSFFPVFEVSRHPLWNWFLFGRRASPYLYPLIPFG